MMIGTVNSLLLLVWRAHIEVNSYPRKRDVPLMGNRRGCSLTSLSDKMRKSYHVSQDGAKSVLYLLFNYFLFFR